MVAPAQGTLVGFLRLTEIRVVPAQTGALGVFLGGYATCVARCFLVLHGPCRNEKVLTF